MGNEGSQTRQPGGQGRSELEVRNDCVSRCSDEGGYRRGQVHERTNAVDLGQLKGPGAGQYGVKEPATKVPA